MTSIEVTFHPTIDPKDIKRIVAGVCLEYADTDLTETEKINEISKEVSEVVGRYYTIKVGNRITKERMQ